MNAEKQHEMVSKLYQSTVDENIAWEKTAQKEAFQVTVKNYVLTILLEGEDLDDPSCRLQICDLDGDVVDNIVWSNLKDVVTPDKTPGQRILYQLHDTARRSAMGSDKAIKEIIAELDSIPPF